MGYLARALSALTLVAGLALSTPAAAATRTLAEFRSIEAPAVEWTRSEDGQGGTLARVRPGFILFSFKEISNGFATDPSLQNLGAYLYLDLTKPEDSPYFSGTFSFIYQGGTRDWSGGQLHYGDNLLSGDINSGFVRAATEFHAYQGLGDFTMNATSSVIQDFDEPDGFTWFIMQMTSDPPIPAGGLTATPGFQATVSGRLMSGIPEPSTWAFLIVGFGLAGAALRARPRTAVA